MPVPPRTTSVSVWIAFVFLSTLASIPRYLVLVDQVRASTRKELLALLRDEARADQVAVLSVVGVAVFFVVVLIVVACTGNALERRYARRSWSLGPVDFGTGVVTAALMTLPVQLLSGFLGFGTVPPLAMVYVLIVAAILPPLLLRPERLAQGYAVTLPLGVLLLLQ
ncbi:hypothetical protein D9V32_06740 [Mycetocola tolaasinivorans]|uniref:Uncharacterized protein n=1 Tax=Mycetocola tolaasinivorans TaxID=76635 RepID=A0A3L7AA63_9MICO|nr:hypothetical protein D9V32_06740 [Mycetocola tolaasinivorans]